MMKKAFSLIEIMQTVVLLGIIAGLSISFFKKINSDQKLYFSTEKQLTATIKQVERTMCADSTPVCVLAGETTLKKFEDLAATNAWNCQRIYGANVELSNGYCRQTNTNNCNVIDPANANVPVGANYEAMIKGSDGHCYAPPPCPNQFVLQDGTNSWTAVPMNKMTCPNGTPEHATDIYNLGNNTSYPAFCTYFNKTVAHKRQGTNENADLDRTCDENSTILNGQTLPTGIKAKVEEKAGGDGIDNYNILLPNGVYLYNLHDGPNNIIIKYDRDSGIESSYYDASDAKNTNIRMYSYTKAVYNNGDGEVKTMSDNDLATWQDRSDDDKEKCPGGGKYTGTDAQSGKAKCEYRSNSDIQHCPNGGSYNATTGKCDITSGTTSQNTSQNTNTTTQPNDGPSTNP